MTFALAREAGAIGVIVDEAHIMTAGVQRKEKKGCGLHAYRIRHYFRLWHRWDHEDEFVRMDITGSRGGRLARQVAAKPPRLHRNDTDRLRIVRPLASDMATFAAAQAAAPRGLACSPACEPTEPSAAAADILRRMCSGQ